MSIYDEQPVANGLRTDHPVPDLPFVDDSHLPLEDPEAIERIGRRPGGDTWGRYDADDNGEWIALTTDPKNNEYCWAVRYHPKHGRSVLLYRDADLSDVHSQWTFDRPLLIRWGGYWWDGTAWYRPPQVIRWGSGEYVRRPVPRSTVITADDLLDSACDASRGELYKVARFEPREVASDQWQHDLARWAQSRPAQSATLPLDQCIVTLSAPELAEGRLIGVDQLAETAGIAASTLRAYINRDEGSVPAPQLVTAGRRMWSRPVASDWAEQRKLDPREVVKVLTGENESTPPGVRSLTHRIAEVMFNLLWSGPEARRRWARPHRNEQSVRTLTTGLARWAAATAIESLPRQGIESAVEQSVLWEMSDESRAGGRDHFITLAIDTGQLLGWFVTHYPSRAPHLFEHIVNRAERFGVRQEVTIRTLRRAVLLLDDKVGLTEEQVNTFFEWASPAAS